MISQSSKPSSATLANSWARRFQTVSSLSAFYPFKMCQKHCAILWYFSILANLQEPRICKGISDFHARPHQTLVAPVNPPQLRSDGDVSWSEYLKTHGDPCPSNALWNGTMSALASKKSTVWVDNGILLRWIGQRKSTVAFALPSCTVQREEIDKLATTCGSSVACMYSHGNLCLS